MKPHLIRISGLWFCSTRRTSLFGIGYTPASAYRDWVSLMKAKS